MLQVLGQAANHIRQERRVYSTKVMLNTITPCMSGPLTDQPPFTLSPPHSQAPRAKCKEAQGGRSTSIQAAPYQLPCYPLHSCQQTAKGQAEKVIRGRLLRNTSKVRLSTRPGLDDFTLGDWCVVTPILLLGHFTYSLVSASCSKHLSQPLPRLIQPHTQQYPLNTGSAPPSAPKHPTGGTNTQSGGTGQQDSFFSRPWCVWQQLSAVDPGIGGH